MKRKYSSSFDDLLSDGQKQFDELIGQSQASSSERILEAVPASDESSNSPDLPMATAIGTPNSKAIQRQGTSRGIPFILTPRSN